MTATANDLKPVHVVLIGDIILEETMTGEVVGLSPDAPVPTLKIIRSDRELGGVAAPVQRLLSHVDQLTLFSIIGKDLNGNRVIEELDRFQDLEAFVFVDDVMITQVRSKFVGNGQTILSIDQTQNQMLATAFEDQVINKLRDAWGLLDLVIVSDFNLGFMTKKINEFLDITQEAGISGPRIVRNFTKGHDIRDFLPNK